MRMESYVAHKADYQHVSEFEKARNDEKTIRELLEKYDPNKPADLKRLYMQLQYGKVLLFSDLGDRFTEDITNLYEKGTISISEKAHTNKTQIKKTEKKALDSKRFEELDKSMQESILIELKRTQKKRRTLITILSALAVLSIGYFVWYYKHADSTNSRMEELADLVGSDVLLGNETEEEEPLVIHYDDKDVVVPPVLYKYKTLYTKNNHLIGWIKIADTIIDYPVMQGDDNDYYLKHNFDEKEDQIGSIFMDCACDVVRGCDNFILYGHHLQSGKMFSQIEKYEKKDFYDKHPYVTFDTIYEEHTYQVMYVFRSKVYEVNDMVFKYYQFINANSEEEFNSAMAEMKSLSFYDTGVTAHYGDQLLTLSTCDYVEMNGRFVVVCKQIQ